MERLNKFQTSLSKVVSLIKENKIKESYALYKEACTVFFSQDGEFIYNKNKDAFEYVNNHFEEFAKWLSNFEKAKWQRQHTHFGLLSFLISFAAQAQAQTYNDSR